MPHSVLRFRTGALIAFIAGLAASLGTWFLHPRPVAGVTVGCILGAVGGWLQRRSLSEDRARYLSAASFSDVRRVMSSTASGRRYFIVQYGALALLLVIGLAFSRLGVLEVAVGYMAFIGVRELVTLGALLELEKSAARV